MLQFAATAVAFNVGTAEAQRLQGAHREARQPLSELLAVPSKAAAGETLSKAAPCGGQAQPLELHEDDADLAYSC